MKHQKKKKSQIKGVEVEESGKDRFFTQKYTAYRIMALSFSLSSLQSGYCVWKSYSRNLGDKLLTEASKLEGISFQSLRFNCGVKSIQNCPISVDCYIQSPEFCIDLNLFPVVESTLLKLKKLIT